MSERATGGGSLAHVAHQKCWYMQNEHLVKFNCKAHQKAQDKKSITAPKTSANGPTFLGKKAIPQQVLEVKIYSRLSQMELRSFAVISAAFSHMAMA